LLSAVVLIIKLKHNVNIGKHFNSFLVIKSDFHTFYATLYLDFCRLDIADIIDNKKVANFAPYIFTGPVFNSRLTNLL